LRAQKEKLTLSQGDPVAIYHLSVKAFSRSAGRSATAAAAYRAAERIEDKRTGEVHDYTHKGGVEDTELVLPAGAPAWAQDRAALWNAAEEAERRKNSTVAREFEIALPEELTAEQRRELALAFAKELVERHGFAADVAIHQPSRHGDDRNYHAHILVSTRQLAPEGFTQKTRELDDKVWGSYAVQHWRERFAELQNSALERHGHVERVDHRTLEAQGIEREPTVHLGPHATGYERRTGEQSRRSQELDQQAAERAQARAAAQEQARELAEAQKRLEELERQAARIAREEARAAELRAEHQRAVERMRQEAKEREEAAKAREAAQEAAEAERIRAEISRIRQEQAERLKDSPPLFDLSRFSALAEPPRPEPAMQAPAQTREPTPTPKAPKPEREERAPGLLARVKGLFSRKEKPLEQERAPELAQTREPMPARATSGPEPEPQRRPALDLAADFDAILEKQRRELVARREEQERPRDPEHTEPERPQSLTDLIRAQVGAGLEESKDSWREEMRRKHQKAEEEAAKKRAEREGRAPEAQRPEPTPVRAAPQTQDAEAVKAAARESVARLREERRAGAEAERRQKEPPERKGPDRGDRER
jgi:hypothetical protein